MSRLIDTWSIQITGPDTAPLAEQEPTPSWMDAALAEAEENLTDLLPDGYEAKIIRWDAEVTDL